jgi:cysteine desulfurase
MQAQPPGIYTICSTNEETVTMKTKIYLDYAATTPVDKRVLDTMQPYWDDRFGNASSLHTYGTEAKEALENARVTLSGYIGAQPDELVFTSGGTESNNLALKGIAFANRQRGNHLIVSSIEHDCILNTCKWLEEQGFYITCLPVDDQGMVDLEFLEKAIHPKTILVSVMHANNEIGTIQPIDLIGGICRRREVYFHCDACQSFGKIPLNVNTSHIDLLTVNSHKICGPKGVGALYVKKGTRITPLFHGGGQEAGLRSTTENIPAIKGFEKAASLCFEDIGQEGRRLSALRDQLASWLVENYENVYFNGHEKNRLPGYLNFSFHGLEGETIRLLLLLDELGIAVSAGSACSSHHGGSASHVLQAIGLNPLEARGGIRVSMGRFTTEKDIIVFTDALKQCIPALNTIFSH